MSFRSRPPASRALQFAAVSVALAASAMCGDPPTAPGGSGPARSLTGIELVGPAVVAPGESAQFALEMIYNDGSRGPSTLPVTWRTSREQVLATTDTGLVTGRQAGSANLTAQVGNRSSTRNVVVVPSGTSWITGVITETNTTTFALSNTTVTVVSGTGGGARAVTGADGRYELFGVSGRITVRFEKDGYVPVELEVDVSGPQTVNAALEPKEARASFAGQYTMTFAAASECRSQLPEAAWERSYAAELRQDGPALVVTLGGATFATVSGAVQNSFRGTALGSQLTLWMSPWDFYYYLLPGVIETVASDLYFAPSGNAAFTASVSAGSIEMRGTFDGWIYIFGSVSQFNVTSSCRSANHQLAFTR